MEFKLTVEQAKEISAKSSYYPHDLIFGLDGSGVNVYWDVAFRPHIGRITYEESLGTCMFWNNATLTRFNSAQLGAIFTWVNYMNKFASEFFEQVKIEGDEH